MKVAVYTAMFDGYDKVPDVVPEKGVDYYAYTDTPWMIGTGWTIVMCGKVFDGRKTARWYKTHSHVLFPKYDYTIWVDGRIQLNKPIKNFINLLKDNHIASKVHPWRKCIYEEYEECVRQKLDDIPKMTQQMNIIKDKKYPANNGLAETMILVRDNSIKVSRINNSWWNIINNLSLRDQLSFNFVLWLDKIDWVKIPKSYIKVGEHERKNYRSYPNK
jgi:hypothetical protein